MNYKKLVSMSVLAAAFLGIMFVGNTSKAHAEINLSGNGEVKTNLYKSWDNDKDDTENHQGMVGTVTAVNSTSLSVKNNRDGKIYTVTSADAKILHGSLVGTLADIKVGDLVIIKGSMTGSMSMSATEIKNPQYTDKYPDNDKGGNLKLGIMGTVTAINNTNLTVTDKNGKVYTVATADAKFQKDQGTMITVNDIRTGDTVMIQGSVNGNNVTATNVFDVQIYTDAWMEKHSMYEGTVTAVSDTTITMKDDSGKIYTVNTADAKFRTTMSGKDSGSATMSDIKVGDKITAQGDLMGSNIDANTVYDGQLSLDMNNPPREGFFHKIGHFFKKLFGRGDK